MSDGDDKTPPQGVPLRPTMLKSVALDMFVWKSRRLIRKLEVMAHELERGTPEQIAARLIEAQKLLGEHGDYAHDVRVALRED